MTRNTKIKNYLKEHPGATIEDYHNERHKMHVQQAKMTTFAKHTGSKKYNVLMYHIHKIDKNRNTLMKRLFGI